jgi:ribosomal protein S12 methylthiotransferase accessory factor
MTDTAVAPSVAVPDGIRAWLGDGLVSVGVGFDLDHERQQLAEAARQGRELLSIRLAGDAVLIGPRWVPGGASSCAGCAEARLRLVVDHPLLTRVDLNASPRTGWPAALAILLDVGLAHLSDSPLAPGEMLRVGLSETRRHRVARSLACPVCAADRGAAPVSQGHRPESRPQPLVLRSRPTPDRVPLRGRPSAALTNEALARLVDHRVGPVVQVRRDNRAPFAMSAAVVPASRDMGFGRGRDFAQSWSVAILEAYERLGAFPHEGQILQDLCYDEIRELAVDPDTLGRYAAAQLAHPNARVMAYRPDQPMDWAYAHDLLDGTAWLVPADVAFYGYEYQHRLDYHGARRHRAPGRRRTRFFAESSSGCALGSSMEEAALHGLQELVERDAFLMAWCRRVPLPAIDEGSLDDPTSRMLLDAIQDRGFDVHLLATTYDLGLPSIWALAVNRDPGAVPATYSAAGSGPVPAEAVRAALWELAQLAAHPVDWDVESVRPLVADASLVDGLEEHVHRYAMPECRDRVMEVLGGPRTSLEGAFPGWPDELVEAARGDVRGALEFLLAQCQAAGLDQALVVDQSTREHRDLGLSVARVVVPGILPMCFGSPQQRLGGLIRRQRALAALGRPGDDPATDPLFDPHPFP